MPADWHYDAITPNYLTPGRGQRLATLLVYLNDVPSGGSTTFRDLRAGGISDAGRLAVSPKQGRALLFFPSAADGEPDFRMEHAGEAAKHDKWIAQIWLQDGGPYEAHVPAGTSQAEGTRLAREYAEAQMAQGRRAQPGC